MQDFVSLAAHVGGPRVAQLLGRGGRVLCGHVVNARAQVPGAARARAARGGRAAREGLPRQAPPSQTRGLLRLIPFHSRAFLRLLRHCIHTSYA